MKDNYEPEEIWVTLKHKDENLSRYKISNYSTIWDCKLDKEVSQVITGVPQYYYVNLTTDEGDRILRRVNRCVSFSFHGKPPKGCTSDHIDRDKLNNVEWNLRWATRDEQLANRDCTATMPCGTPIVKYVQNLGYDPYKGIGLFFVNRWRVDNTTSLTDNIFGWANLLNPYPLTWKERNPTYSVEYEGIWYPTLKSLTEDKGNCKVKTLRYRINSGIPLKDALTYVQDSSEISKKMLLNLHGTWVDGCYDTIVGHCSRNNVSYPRISALMKKKGVSLEEALKSPVERVIKHNINGITKRNIHWYEHFNIEGRTANSWLSRNNKKGKPRTFRDLLEYYGVDTTHMEIYPCDGDVVMYHKSI